MKLLFIFLIYLLMIQINYSQNYKFDLLTNYSSKVNGEVFEKIVYSNSKNDKFFLTVGGFQDASKATLIDLKKRIYHKYKLTQTKIKEETFFTFKYKYTANFKNNSKYINLDFAFEEVESDSIFKKVKLLVYKNSKKNKIITSRTVILKKSDNQSFSLYRVSCLHPFELMDKIKYSGNYIVISATGTTSGGYKIENKLLLTKPIYLEMNIPN